MPRVTYMLTFLHDQERIANLNYIYNNNEVEAVNMFRMRKRFLTNLWRHYGQGCFLKIASTHAS
jgi:hypothetical protein